MIAALALRQATAQLDAAGISNARHEAEWLLADALGVERLELYTGADREMSASIADRFLGAIDRRAAGEPLQYVLGWEEFYGLRLEVGPAALIPRPETELLVDAAVAQLSTVSLTDGPPRFLDVGTGTGAIAIAVACEAASSKGVAIDCSAPALALAQCNRARYMLESRLTLLGGDLCGPLSARNRFHVVMANLPYVCSGAITSLEPGVRDWEPRLALDGGGDGLVLMARLLADAGPLMAPVGRLMLEIGAGQSHEVARLAARHGWIVKKIVADLSGIERVVVLSRKAAP